MNTQRPEWNDANNALVGKGLSVVTLSYLLRYIVFCKDLLKQEADTTVQLSVEVQGFYSQIFEILNQFTGMLAASFSDEQRRDMMNALGQAGSDYRWNYYAQGISGEAVQLPTAELIAFLDLAHQFVENTLHANKRSDDLYHAYNVLILGDKTGSANLLYEMLE